MNKKQVEHIAKKIRCPEKSEAIWSVICGVLTSYQAEITYGVSKNTLANTVKVVKKFHKWAMGHNQLGGKDD